MVTKISQLNMTIYFFKILADQISTPTDNVSILLAGHLLRSYMCKAMESFLCSHFHLSSRSYLLSNFYIIVNDLTWANFWCFISKGKESHTDKKVCQWEWPIIECFFSKLHHLDSNDWIAVKSEPMLIMFSGGIYQVCATYADGFRATAVCPVGGPFASLKAKKTGEALLKR